MIAGLTKRVIVVEDKPVSEMVRAIREQGLVPKQTRYGLVVRTEAKFTYYLAREQFINNPIPMPVDIVRFTFKPFGHEIDEAFEAVRKLQGSVYESQELISSAAKFGGGDRARLRKAA